jgi:predicted Zn-dependent protease
MCKQAAIAMTMMLALTLACAAQNRISPVSSSISGRVVTLDGHPVANARVEIRDTTTGATVQSFYTDARGQFEFDNVAAGKYLLAASSGLDQVEETAQVGGIASTVVLRLLRAANSGPEGSGPVSVQQLKVPGKAHSALKHAQEALAAQRLDQAWKHVTQALTIYPRYAEALVLRGILKLDKHDLEGARTDMEEAIQDDPSYGMGYIALGATYNALSQFDDALRTLDRGVAIAPVAWQGYFEMGKAYLGKGDFQASLRQLDKTQRLAPQSYAPVHLVKAHALLGLKAYDEAISELEVYLNQDPKGEASEDARDTLQKARSFAAGKQ